MLSKVQLFSSYFLGYTVPWRFWTKGWLNQWINWSMSNKGDCNTAPATPGLLNIKKKEESTISSTKSTPPKESSRFRERERGRERREKGVRRRRNNHFISNRSFWYFSCIIATRRYGLLREPTSSSCGGLRPLSEVFFCPLGKKTNYYAFWANFRQFWFPVETLVTLKII